MNDLDVSVSERQLGRVYGGPINLSRTELRRARLDQATLSEANLMGAILTEADLSNARLDKADLRGAKLAHATLRGARLEGANLGGADLSLAAGLTQAQIDEALGDCRTALPVDLRPPRAWLGGYRSQFRQLVTQSNRAKPSGEESADPYEILGVSPGTSIQDIRVVWLKLVKELHPDVSPGEAPVTERLKTINQAYQKLKNVEGQATRWHGTSGRYRVFAAFFVIAIVVGAVVALYLTRPGVQDDAAPPARTGMQEDRPRTPLRDRRPGRRADSHRAMKGAAPDSRPRLA